MKVVLAPDKFKGSLTGFEFCDAVEKGLNQVFKNIEIVKMPLADGGDGTIDVVRHYIQGERTNIMATNPFFKPIQSSYILSKATNVAFIEMAETSGLKLLTQDELDCMNGTSLGFGELIFDAIERGTKELILGIGGSATNDGGMGMAQALGFRFLDYNDEQLKPIGSSLIKVRKIDTSNVHPKINNIKIKVACDVSNPFYGSEGAAYIYAAQKGASEEEIELLDKGLQNYAKIIQKEFGVNVQDLKGAGAAGGMGAAASVFLKGELVSGIDLIKDLADFDSAINDADWIITGEGQLDTQTLSGKTIAGVLTSAKKRNIPVAALCGSIAISKKESSSFGLNYIASISEGCNDLEESILNAYSNLAKASEKFAKTLK